MMMMMNFRVNRGKTIECRCHDSVRHHNVTVHGERYTFGLASFDSVQEFLDHFDKQPIVAGESGKKNSRFCFTV